MTREQMCKVKWLPFMRVVFQEPRMEFPCECMVVAVNFDGEIVLLRAFDDQPYEEDDMWANLKFVNLPKPKPRLVK